MKCLHCGGYLEETDKRCPYCNSVNENYKAPEPEKPTEQVAPVSAPQVIHIYHDEPKRKKRKFKFSLKKLVITAIIVILAIVFIRVALT